MRYDNKYGSYQNYHAKKDPPPDDNINYMENIKNNKLRYNFEEKNKSDRDPMKF
jgi:hypothetical protein